MYPALFLYLLLCQFAFLRVVLLCCCAVVFVSFNIFIVSVGFVSVVLMSLVFLTLLYRGPTRSPQIVVRASVRPSNELVGRRLLTPRKFPNKFEYDSVFTFININLGRILN